MWNALDPGKFKVNVDASVFPNASSFTVGMVMRNHQGTFIAGKVICLPMVELVFEAETVGINEALSWIKTQQFQDNAVMVESDSMLVVNSIKSDRENLLEVGEIIERVQTEAG